MKTTDLSERAPNRLRHALLAAVLAVLGGCGPGTGGTGTGPDALFASSTGADGLPSGSACATICTNVAVRLEGERIEVTAPCLRFVHSAEWLPPLAGDVVLPGTLERQVNGLPQVEAGTLRLQAGGDVANAGQVTVTVSNAQGQPVLGPVLLQRQPPGPAAPVKCMG